MKAIRPILSASILLAVTAAPALGTHGGIHPTFRTEPTYFHCNGQTKVYQVNWAALGLESAYVPWNTTPPADSVTDGAGCGGLDWGGTTNPLYDTTFRGVFNGNLRDMTIRIHALLLSQARVDPTSTLRLEGDIDGVPIFPPGGQPNHGRTVTVTPVKSSTGVSEVYEFSITNLGFATDVLDEQGNVVDVEHGGAALENGDGEMEHVITLFIGHHGTGFGQDPAGHKVGAWAWDTTEVPSGITFNPGTLATAKVAANLPQL